MSNSSRIHEYWMQHIHSFFITVRFSSALADALTTAIVTIYLLGKGLSFTEIGIVWSLSLFVATVLDFPTGNFADIYGRRLAFVIGVVSVGIGAFIFGVGTTMEVFLIAALFEGFGTAQISGSISSWVVDEQIKLEKQDAIAKIFGDGGAAASVGGIVGGLCIGLFFTGPLELLFFLSGTVYILTGIFVFISVPDNFGQPSGKWLSLPKEVISHFIHAVPLIMLSAALVLMFACFTVFAFVWQPLALELGIVKGDLGYFYAIFMGGTAVGAFLMGRIAKKIGERITLISNFVLVGAGFSIISADFGIGGLITGIVMFAVGYGGAVPLLSAYMSIFIPSSIRASTMSLVGTIATGGITVLQIAVGAFIESRGLIAASLVAVGIALIGILILLVFSEKSPAQEG